MTCQVSISHRGGWHFEPCGRSFKTEEQERAGLCGIHLAAKKRKDKKLAEEKNRLVRSALLRSAAEECCAELRRDYNVDANPISADGYFTGSIEVHNAGHLLSMLRTARDKEGKP